MCLCEAMIVMSLIGLQDRACAETLQEICCQTSCSLPQHCSWATNHGPACRYKELAKIGKDKTNFPTKRAMDNVAKQLRSQAGTSTRAIGDF